jgi:C-terminal processing protease CtpA/Prc
MVESLLANSPAERAGMRTGDQVLAVDGRDIAAWDLPQLSDLFDDGEPGRKVPVRVERDGNEKKLTTQARRGGALARSRWPARVRRA